jgi:hypothetical protein
MTQQFIEREGTGTVVYWGDLPPPDQQALIVLLRLDENGDAPALIGYWPDRDSVHQRAEWDECYEPLIPFTLEILREDQSEGVFRRLMLVPEWPPIPCDPDTGKPRERSARELRRQYLATSPRLLGAATPITLMPGVDPDKLGEECDKWDRHLNEPEAE